MFEDKNTIDTNYLDKLSEKFEYITYLLSQEHYDQAIALLLELHYADFADFIDNTSKKYCKIILPAVADQINPEFLCCLHDHHRKRAIEIIGTKKSAKLVDQLDIEDAIETIEDLDIELKESIINLLPNEKRQQILEGFAHTENTAGRILEKNFISFQQNQTVGQAISQLKKLDISANFHAAIIVDSRFKPVGIITVGTLLKNSAEISLEKIMDKEFKIAQTHTSTDELAFIFKQYALTIVPVTNKQGKLLGSISIDNMIYIIAEKTENKFLYLGGVNQSDIFSNLFSGARDRFPWLFVNLITACLTSLVINHFSDTIAKLITLATIMPIVASMGGNAGTQSMTVTVRAISNREINNANTRRVIFKEIMLCLVNGLLLASIGSAITYFLFWDLDISVIFAAAVLMNFVVAGLLGSIIPIFLDHCNIDPATASGVFLTAFTDAIGFFSFLSLAYVFLV